MLLVRLSATMLPSSELALCRTDAEAARLLLISGRIPRLVGTGFPRAAERGVTADAKRSEGCSRNDTLPAFSQALPAAHIDSLCY